MRQRASRRNVSSRLTRREMRWGLLFISPWLIGFLAFYLLPMIASFGFSLYDFTIARAGQTKFIGLGNWRRFFFEDPDGLASIVKIFKFMLIAHPVGLGMALSLAVLLNSKHLLGKPLFRTLFYMPTIIPFIATVLIWNGVLNEYTGWVNLFLENVLGLKAIGDQGLLWLRSPALIYYSYTMIGLWSLGNAILIFLAGLQNIPTELYEAAMIDGAGWWSSLFRITLPMLSPVIFYNLTVGTIVLMQYFLVPYVLTGSSLYPGFPEGSTNFIMVYFYKQAFMFFNMGYAATIAWVIFLISLALTALLFGTAKYWVYYAGEK